MSTTPRRFPQQIYITNSTNSTSLNTGSLINSGGQSINGNLSISGTSQYFNGTFYAGITSPSIEPTSSYLLRLPTGLPTISGSYLQSDTSGNLTYSTGITNTYTIGTTIPVIDTNISGLIYTSLQFDILVTINITASPSYIQIFRLTGINASSGWVLSSIGVSGDTSGIIFSIVSGTGQVQFRGTGSYNSVTNAIISWTNYQSFPNSTNISSLANNLTITGTGNLTESSSTLFINPSSTTLTGSNNYYFTYLSTPTITGTTTGSAYTFFINGAPNGASNSYSLYVNSGNSYLGGNLNISSLTALRGVATDASKNLISVYTPNFTTNTFTSVSVITIPIDTSKLIVEISIIASINAISDITLRGNTASDGSGTPIAVGEPKETIVKYLVDANVLTATGVIAKDFENSAVSGSANFTIRLNCGDIVRKLYLVDTAYVYSGVGASRVSASGFMGATINSIQLVSSTAGVLSGSWHARYY